MRSIVYTWKDRMETARDREPKFRQLEQSKMEGAEDEILTAHEVCKHLALRYVYELDNYH